MKHGMMLKELKCDTADLLLYRFSSPFCKYLSLKLRWSAIKIWSTSVHTTLSVRCCWSSEETFDNLCQIIRDGSWAQTSRSRATNLTDPLSKRSMTISTLH